MRTKEQGSVVGYVLGIILLLAMLLGGIALYKNYAAKPGSSDNQVANEQKTSDDQTSKNEAALKQQQEQAAKKAEDEQKAAANNSGAAATQVPVTSTAPSSNLPQTGPGDVWVAMIGSAALAGAAVAYIRSRTDL